MRIILLSGVSPLFMRVLGLVVSPDAGAGLERMKT